MILGLDKLTTSAGVYIFRDKKKKIIYIGKASNLKNRVSSYFQPSAALSPRIAAMVKQVVEVELKETGGEIPALILESSLIKKYSPPFNVKSKDDKSSFYLVVNKQFDFPRVTLSRYITSAKQKAYGPYPETNLVWAVKNLRRSFTWADCSQTKFLRQQNLNRPCLYGDVGMCLAPCVGKIDKESYQEKILLLEKFLTGKFRALLRDLKKKMLDFSKQANYEEAAKIRDQIQRLERLTTAKASFEDTSSLLLDKKYTSLEACEQLFSLLKKYFPLPKDKNTFERIEAFDISNFSGKQAVGSMVVFTDGQPNKAEYRRFKIKTVKGPNDPAMMAEVVKRRFKRWPFTLPDLVLIDGGKTQVSQVLSVIEDLQLKVPILGLAKREELLVIPGKEKYLVKALSRSSKALHLLQSLRDESHRFAVSYHRLLREKKFTQKI